MPPVDLITAGWPCQDISYAGPGAGITEGTRSGLWLTIAGGLRRLRPSYVFLENVAALRTRGLGRVLGDLAALGYDTQWLCIRAADAGACHGRGRLFILGCQPAAQARLALLPATRADWALNDGEPAESWPARRNQHKQPGRNDGTAAPLGIAIALLPAPMASDSAAEGAPQPGGQRPSAARRQAGLPEVIVHHLARLHHGSVRAQPAAGERLLPTPDTGTSPNGHGRRGGRPGNGHQSGKDLDAAARILTAPGGSLTPPGAARTM